MVLDLSWKYPMEDQARHAPEALIVVVAAYDAQTEAEIFRRGWQAAVPRAEFVGIPLEIAHDRFNEGIANAAAQRMLSPRRTILLGRGIAGRVALDLLLEGHLSAAGILAIDIALWPSSRSGRQSETIVRLIRHQGSDDPGGTRHSDLLAEIQRAAPDVRHTVLSGGEAAADAELRTGTSYLVELVAHASLPRDMETSP